MRPVPEISVVVPCHNEEGNIAPLVAAIVAALEPADRPFEIVLTDDASTDRTWQLIEQAGAADGRVRGQRLACNTGQSAAMWAGIKAARGQILITLDADLQNPPAEIPRFLAALGAEVDCVCGSRVAARAKGDNWVRRASSKIANAVRNRLSGETISDAGCCFRAFRRQCVADIKFFKGGHRFLPTLIKMEGFRVAEIDIGHGIRQSGVSHYGISNRLFKSFADLLAVRWMKKRLIRYRVSQEVNRP